MTWTLRALVVVSPPSRGRPWQAHGYLGYAQNNSDVSGAITTLDTFVRLPDARPAARVVVDSSAGDCGEQISDEILVLSDGRWASAARKIRAPCGPVTEPEQFDVF